MLKFAQAGALAGAGLVLALCAVGWLSPDAPRAASRLQLVEVPMRRFAFRNPNGAVAAPRRLRIAPFQALYSASLGEDPQSFLQKAPEQGKPGLFRSYMPPLRGEAGGTPEYKYSEEMPLCPCAGVAGMCLDLLMDEPFDQGPTPCECLCGKERDPQPPEFEDDDDCNAAHHWICSHGHM